MSRSSVTPVMLYASFWNKTLFSPCGSSYFQDGLLSFVNGSYSSGKISFGVGVWQTYEGAFIEREGINSGADPDFANRLKFSVVDMGGRLNNGFYFTGAPYVGISAFPNRNYGLSVNGNSILNNEVQIAGEFRPPTNKWNRSWDGYNRFYFENGGRSYYGSQNGYEFKHSQDVALFTIDNVGAVLAYGNIDTTTGYSIKTSSYFFHNNWNLYIGTSPNNAAESLIFWHTKTGATSKWWLNGSQNGTSSEISDERIKKKSKILMNH